MKDYERMTIVAFMMAVIVLFTIVNFHMVQLEKQCNEIISRVALIQAEVYGE